MPILTSAQEAAFNAAGEAMTDLYAEGVKFTIGALATYGDKPMRFYAFGDHPISGNSTVFGDNAPTMAEAVSSLLTKFATALTEPPKIATAKAALAAAADLAAHHVADPADARRLIHALDALPVA